MKSSYVAMNPKSESLNLNSQSATSSGGRCIDGDRGDWEFQITRERNGDHKRAALNVRESPYLTQLTRLMKSNWPWMDPLKHLLLVTIQNSPFKTFTPQTKSSKRGLLPLLEAAQATPLGPCHRLRCSLKRSPGLVEGFSCSRALFWEAV